MSVAPLRASSAGALSGPTSTAGSATPARRSKRGKRSPGWMPNQHGAWGMLASPLIAGAFAAGPRWTQLAVATTWVLGYFAFFATSLWLKAARKERYRTPMAVYCALAAAAGVITLCLTPHLILWGPPFGVLSGIALFEAAQRRDRSLASGLSTIVAAAGLTFVMVDAGGGLSDRAGVVNTTFLALAQLGYLVGVLLYVKTMIRERNNPRFKTMSVAWHAVILCASAAWAYVHPWALGLVIVYAVMWARARMLPGRALRPKQVGQLEMPIHAAVLIAALIAVLV